jgi:hypothetical protein
MLFNTFGRSLSTRLQPIQSYMTGGSPFPLVHFAAKWSKDVIRQDRPTVTVPSRSDLYDKDNEDTSSRQRRPGPKKKVKRTYGMPSTHSTSISFYMAYLVLSLPPLGSGSKAKPHRVGGRGAFEGVSGGLMALGTIVWGTAIMWSRVRIGYHTLAQVLVGAIIGLSGGVSWRWLWDTQLVGIGGWERVLQGWVDRAFGMVGL